MIFFFVLLPFFIAIVYFIYKMYSITQKSHNVHTEKRFIQNKIQEIENYNIDFHGQTIFEKMEDNVQYFANPIKKEDEDELRSQKKLNVEIELLKAERKRLINQKNQQIERNRKKVYQIKKLRELIENIDD